MAKTIITREAFQSALSELFSQTDFALVGGTVKPHKAEDKDGRPTGEDKGVFMSMNTRLTGVQEIGFEGDDYYSKSVNVSINAFKLAGQLDTTQDVSDAPKAATISADALRAKLKGTAPKAASPQPGDVVAVNA